MPMTIVVLEDHDGRTDLMRRFLHDKFPFFQLQFFRSSQSAIAWLRENLDAVICISLDHDLERPPNEPDPGTGREVADFLATQKPRCPAIIHSTNFHAAIGMESALDEAGWNVSRVCPYGDMEWIAEAWLPVVRTAIVAQAETAQSPSILKS